MLPTNALGSVSLSNDSRLKLFFLSALLAALSRSNTTLAFAQALDPASRCSAQAAGVRIAIDEAGASKALSAISSVWKQALVVAASSNATQDYLAGLVRQRLTELQPDLPFTPNRIALVSALARDLKAAAEVEVSLSYARGDELRAKVGELVGIIARALGESWALVEDQRPPPFDDSARGVAIEVLDALLTDDAPRAFEIVTRQLGAGALPESVLRVAQAGVKLTVARTRVDVEREVKSFIVPAWLLGLIFDARVSVPVVDSEQFHLDLAGTVGWEAKRWGFWISGRRSVYDAQINTRDLTEAQANVAGRAWLNIGEVDAFAGLSVGAVFGFDQISSDLTLLDSTAITSSEVSQFVRGSLTLGAWLHPTPVVVMRLALAGGLHREFYNRDLLTPTGPDAGYTSVETRSSSGDYRGRAQLTDRIWPGILRASMQAEVAYYQITRSNDYFAYSFSQLVSEHSSSVSAARLEASAQLVLELEAAEFFNLLRPGAFAQVTYLHTDDGKSGVSYTVPTIGLLLRSHVPD